LAKKKKEKEKEAKNNNIMHLVFTRIPDES